MNKTFPPKRPFVKPGTQGITVIPEQEEDRESINKLFLYFTEGNFLRIKDYITQKKLLVDVRDENNNTILHKIIENETLSENQKFELMELCISKGLNLSATNNNNVTPLHLACEIQSEKIVELLLTSGATDKIDQKDWNGKSPIYYSIVGKSITCPSDKDNIVDTIIKNKSDKIDETLKDLSNGINELLASNDPATDTDLSHLKAYIEKFKNILPQKSEEYAKSIRESISNILSDVKINSQDKNKMLLQKIITERDQLVNEYYQTLNHDSIIDFVIQTGQKNAWGVGTDEENKILKIHDINIINDKMENKKIEMEKNNLKTINETLEKMGKYREEIEQYYSDLKLCSGSIYIYMYNLNNNTIESKPIIPDNTMQIFANTKKTVHLSEIDINNAEYDFENTVPIKIINTLNEQYADEFVVDQSDVLSIPPMNMSFNELMDIFHIIVNIELENDDKHNLFKCIIGIEKYNEIFSIFNENGMRNPYDAPPSFEEQFEEIIEKIKQNGTNIEKTENGGMALIFKCEYTNNFECEMTTMKQLYFFSPFKFYLERLNIITDEINKFIILINDHISIKKYDTIINIFFSYIVKLLINFEITMICLSNEHANILNVYDTLSNVISKLSVLKKDRHLKKIGMEINKHLNKFKEINTNYPNIKKKYIEILLPTVNWLNSVSKYIEYDSAHQIFKNYHLIHDFDDNTDSTTSDLDNDTEINKINNVINHKMITINFPNSYDEFLSHFSETDIRLMKQKYIENYIPKITPNYPITYYFEQEQEQQELKFGYLINNDNMRQVYFSSMTNKQKEFTIDKKGDIRKNKTIFFEYGNIAVKKSEQFEKELMKYPILFSILGKEHIGIIKMNITKRFLERIYDLIKQPDDGQPDGQSDGQFGGYLNRQLNGQLNGQPNDEQEKQNNIVQNILKFEKSIQEYRSTPNDHGAVLVIIATYIKNILDKYVLDLIIMSSNRVVLESINQTTMSKFYKELSEELRKNNLIQREVLAQKILGYTLDLSQIYKNVNSDTQNVSHQALHQNMIEKYENKDQENVFKILNDNYQEVKSTQEMCYIINNDILELLIKHKASVNEKDNSGQTPLFTAILMKNVDIINILIANSASIKIKDKSGIDAFSFAMNMYTNSLQKKHINVYKICDNVYEDTFSDYKRRFANNIPLYSNIVLKMALHMLNHHFLILAQKYYGDWDFESFGKIKMLFEKYNMNFDSILPLALTKITKNANTTTTSTTKNKIQSNMQNKIHNLQLEQKNIMDKQNKSSYDDARLVNITEEIKLYTEKMAQQQQPAQQQPAQQQSAQQQQLEQHIINGGAIGAIKLSNSVVSVYDSLFTNVLNANNKKKIKQDVYDETIDYISYLEMWKVYLGQIQNSTPDYTLFMECMNICQINILNENSENSENSEKAKKIRPIFNFYKKIVNPYVKEYLDLPKEYKNGNECLDTIIDIIIHVIKRCVLTSLYYEICANVEAYLNETFKQSNKKVSKNMINVTLNEIIGDKNNYESKLASYIFNIMPKKLVKKTLNIYEGDDGGDNDMDKNDITIDNMFDDILKILNLNTTITIAMDSPLIKNLKDVIFPRQKEYINTSISTMYLLMNNYLYYLYNQSRDITIIQTLKIM